ncbi:MAG: hypothetical protein F4Y55_03555, partial [Gammaproteobacteria bacterium]|nr:hypothetical protein [Gammaproteobacteria bacterium]
MAGQEQPEFGLAPRRHMNQWFPDPDRPKAQEGPLGAVAAVARIRHTGLPRFPAPRTLAGLLLALSCALLPAGASAQDPIIVRVDDISVIEGDDAVFTFELNRAPEEGAGFNLNVNSSNPDQTASISDYDFEAPENNWFSWPAGQANATFTLSTTDDNTHEPDETIHLVLKDAQKMGFGDGVTELTAVATIVDDADLPTLSLSSASADEGGKLKFKAKLSNPSEFEVTAKYEDTGDGTAQSGTRYTALPAGTLTFAAGDLEKEIVIDVLTDQVEQTTDETVILRLSQPANAAFPNEGRTIEATGTIRKDKTLRPQVRLSESVLPVYEGENAVFNVEVLVNEVVAPWDEDINVIWSPVSDAQNSSKLPTASPGSDFSPWNGRVTIPAGKVRAGISLTTRATIANEGTEALGIRIFSAHIGGVLVDFDKDQSVFTTIHEDAAILIRDAPETTEGQAMTFTVDLGAPAVDDVVLTWTTEDGTATAGQDYTAVTNGALTIPAGEKTATLSVTTLQDATDEPDQTLDVVLVKISGTAQEARMRATGVIRDDDARPQISIANVSVTEGAAAQFRISLSAASEKTVAGHWHTEDGSATAGEDYVAASGAFTIAPGDLHADISVVTTDDAYGEETEEFQVVLLRTPEATLAMGKATGAILDNDGGLVQTLSVSDAEAEEDGDGDMTFTVRLSLPAKAPVSVDWKAPPNPFSGADCGGPSNPCLAANTGGRRIDGLDDYTPVAATTLSFAVGEQEKEITVQVHDDSTSELDETLEVILENAVGATIADGTGIGKILDDDRIEFWITNESTEIPEGESLVVTVRRSRTHSGLARHEARPCLPLVDVKAGMATPSFPSSQSARDDDVHLNGRFTFLNQCMQQSDLENFDWQWLYFNPNDLEARFTIYTVQDDRTEGDETFMLHVPGTFADGVLTDWVVQEFTIIDDDSRRLRVERSEGPLWEGEKVVFDLYTDPSLPAGESATINYKTSDGTAAAGQDYTAHADTTLTLNPPSSPDASIATIEVITTEDDALEDDETFTLTFHSPSVGLQLPAHGGEEILETILDDDRGDVSLSDASVAEGGEAQVALLLSDAINEDATVIWETVSGTAESPADFPAVADRSLTIAAGRRSATIRAATTDDTEDEPDEQFEVRIKSITPADFRIGDAAAITIIDDDEATLEVSDIPSASVEENTAWSGPTPSVTGMPVGEVGWTIEGADAALFDVDADTGTLTLPAQDFEAPADQGKNNVYEVTLRATDEDGTTDTEDVTVTVTDVLYGVFKILGYPIGGTKDEGERQAVGLNYESRPKAGGGKWPKELQTLHWRVVFKASDPSDPVAESADFKGETSGIYAPDSEGRRYFPSVRSTQDEFDEPDEEHFQFELFDTSGDFGIEVDGKVVYSHFIDAGILDDDDTPSFSVADASATEGDDMTFTVTRAGASANAVSVDWATALTTGAGAASADDFTHTPEAQTLSFAADETEKTITVAITEDNLYESDETFEVRLSNPAKAADDPGGAPTITDGTATGTIIAPPTISVDAPSVAEGNSGASPLTFTVTLSKASGVEASVQYEDTRSGSAQPGTDYEALSAGTLTFAAGETEQTVTVNVLGDTAAEMDETLVLRLFSPAGAELPDGARQEFVTGTIENDDSELSIGDATATEGGAATFTVSLDTVHGSDVTFTATTSDGTATAPGDYTHKTEALTIPAGQTSVTFDVQTQTDGAVEGEESFTVTLSGASVMIADAEGLGTIADVQAPLSMRIVGTDSAQENLGAATFTVEAALLAGPATSNVSVDVTVGSATDAAKSGADYKPVAKFTVPIASGSSKGSAEFTLTPIDDQIDEGMRERVSVIGSYIGAKASTAVFITDNDSRGIHVSPTQLTVAERDNPDTDIKENQAAFGVRLRTEPTGDVEIAVGFRVAARDGRHVELSTYDLRFTPSDWHKTQWVTLTYSDPDRIDDGESRGGEIRLQMRQTGTDYDTVPDSKVSVRITDKDLPATGVELSVDTDPRPGIQTGIDEDGGAKQVTVTATFTNGAVFTVDRTFQISVGQASDSARKGLDYASVNDFPIRIESFIASGSATFTLTPTDDAFHETDETISVLGAREGFTVTPAAITLSDDEALPVATLTLDPATVDESGASKVSTVTASLDRASSAETTITVSLPSDAPATLSQNAVLTIAAGAKTSTGTVTVTAADNTLDAPNATVAVTATAAGGHGVANPDDATLTIKDDDDTPSFSVADADADEGDAVTFTVTRAGAAGNAVSVDWATALATGAGAASTDDFTHTPAAETLIFAAGDTDKTVTVATTEDDLDEPNETFELELSNAVKAEGDPGGAPTITDDAATGTINDDDDAPMSLTLTLDADTGTDGVQDAIAEDGGKKTVRVTASLDGATTFAEDTDVTVSVGASGDAAVEGTDYTTVADFTLTISAGQSNGQADFDLTPTNDRLDEDDETVSVGGSLSDATVTVTGATLKITDDDDPPTVSVADATAVTEGNDPNTTADMRFTLSLSAVSGRDVTVPYALGGSATGGADYETPSATTLTIAAGSTKGTITVKVKGDTLDEPDETVTVTLGTPTNATASTAEGASTGEGTITDDDATGVTLSAPSGDIVENGGTKVVTVTLGRALEGDETLDVPLDFAGATTFGADYTLAAPSTTPTGVGYSNLASTDLATNPPTITFSGGASAASSATVTLTAITDAIDEGASETVSIGLGTLGANSGANLGGGASGSGMAAFAISDDDTRGVTVTPASLTL